MVPASDHPRSLRAALFASLTAGLVAGAAWGGNAGQECEPKSYGDGVTIEEATAVADILAAPDEHAGEVVRIEGTVVAVCQMRGCWMEIVAGEGDEALRVAVEDDVIVFPIAAKGSHAAAQGSVEVREMTADEWRAWSRHLAEEQGRDEDEIELREGPYRLVQVRGTGAEICE